MSRRARIERAAVLTAGVGALLGGLLVHRLRGEATGGGLVLGTAAGTGLAAAALVVFVGSARGLRAAWASGAWTTAFLVLLFPGYAVTGWLAGAPPPGAPGGWPSVGDEGSLDAALAIVLVYGGPVLAGVLAAAAIRLSCRPPD